MDAQVLCICRLLCVYIYMRGFWMPTPPRCLAEHQRCRRPDLSRAGSRVWSKTPWNCYTTVLFCCFLLLMCFSWMLLAQISGWQHVKRFNFGYGLLINIWQLFHMYTYERCKHCVCIYIYTYVHTYHQIFMSLSLYIYISIHVYTCLYI